MKRTAIALIVLLALLPAALLGQSVEILDQARLWKKTASYTTTNDFVQMPGSVIDLRRFPVNSLAVRVSNAGASNDVNYKVRGSIDCVNYTDVITLLLDGT